jgi:hypothetical protein
MSNSCVWMQVLSNLCSFADPRTSLIFYGAMCLGAAVVSLGLIVLVRSALCLLIQFTA